MPPYGGFIGTKQAKVHKKWQKIQEMLQKFNSFKFGGGVDRRQKAGKPLLHSN